MRSRLTLLCTLLCTLTVMSAGEAQPQVPRVTSFADLAGLHCQSFDINMLYRLASGNLAKHYGKKYSELDCYVRQFVNKDGQDKFVEDEDEDEEEDEEEEELDVPEIDPLVIEYAQGLDCLEGVDRIDAVYAIWRFYRFVLQHDYLLEWMRAKIRSTIGYQAERPSSWMDGEQGKDRIRLEKLFSNQFYEYVDTLMFKDFLHPLLTLLRSNKVVAVSGGMTESGQPMLMQSLQMRAITERVFVAVELVLPKLNAFVFTLPGMPLILSGSSSSLAWAFTGVLIDRTNIEQIQTVDNRFFHYASEEWIKLDRVTQSIETAEGQSPTCAYFHSNYGTLYEKHSREGKQHEYIVRWHENERKVRVLFSEMLQFVIGDGRTDRNMQFPFNSIVLVNQTGIFNYLCFPQHASYFIYADLASPGQHGPYRWATPLKDYLVVTNTILSTIKPLSYIRHDTHNPTEEALNAELKKMKGKFGSVLDLHSFVKSVTGDECLKQQRDSLLQVYRRVKFSFFPEEKMRKQCDQIATMLELWDGKLSSEDYTPVFVLWMYLLKDSSFNHISVSPQGRNVVRHKALSSVYWAKQMQNWLQHGVSFGECDNPEWYVEFERKLNGTGHNSTCFFNVMTALNGTRLILQQYSSDLKKAKLSWFQSEELGQVIDLSETYLGNITQEAFGKYYYQELLLVAQLNSDGVLYSNGRGVQKELYRRGEGNKLEQEEL